MQDNAALLPVLERIAEALERIAPRSGDQADFAQAPAFVWHTERKSFSPVAKPHSLDLDLLKGIDRSKNTLMENTRHFAAKRPANNALLWGARGTGKSSLVKACHKALKDEFPALKLIEVHREDIGELPLIMSHLQAASDFRFILYCDDLSFEAREATYKALKVALEGGIEGRPENVIFYATSNRRHLLPRDMIENEKATAINPGDAVEESVSLSDRFGLWLGFHRHSQDNYLDMIRGYMAYHDLKIKEEAWRPLAIEWAATRGDRSGRVAWQFFQHFSAENGLSFSDLR